MLIMIVLLPKVQSIFNNIFLFIVIAKSILKTHLIYILLKLPYNSFLLKHESLYKKPVELPKVSSQ